MRLIFMKIFAEKSSGATLRRWKTNAIDPDSRSGEITLPILLSILSRTSRYIEAEIDGGCG